MQIREAVQRLETHSLLDRLYKGSAGMLFARLIEEEPLSGEDLCRLRALLEDKEQEK